MSPIKYQNKYAPPSPATARPDRSREDIDTPADMYDFNFCGPVCQLSTSNMELRPIVPSIHANPLHHMFISDSKVNEWFRSPQTVGETVAYIASCKSSPEWLLRAIFIPRSTLGSRSVPEWATIHDETAPVNNKDWVFAGMCNCCVTLGNETMELGVFVCPHARGLGVATTAAALCVKWGMLMPGSGLHREEAKMEADAKEIGTMEMGATGLGLRKILWSDLPDNVASESTAKKLGFKHEGLLKIVSIAPEGKRGNNRGRPGTRNESRDGVDDSKYSITWWDWENDSQTKNNIDRILARRPYEATKKPETDHQD